MIALRIGPVISSSSLLVLATPSLFFSAISLASDEPLRKAIVRVLSILVFPKQTCRSFLYRLSITGKLPAAFMKGSFIIVGTEQEHW